MAATLGWARPSRPRVRFARSTTPTKRGRALGYAYGAGHGGTNGQDLTTFDHCPFSQYYRTPCRMTEQLQVSRLASTPVEMQLHLVSCPV